MSIGLLVAVGSVSFLDLLDQEEEALALQVLEARDPATVAAAMEASRRRLAQGVDSVVRSLPAALRSDLTASRSVAYALIGLADERMLHHPSGGLDRWRERLLEFELYGSALAGQEIVGRARSAARGSPEDAGLTDDATLAPLYLGVFRAGFEGSLRGDTVGLTSLVASLEEAVGARRERPLEIAPDARPSRIGLSPGPLAALGAAVWLVAGFVVWAALSAKPLADSERMAQRIAAGLPASVTAEPLERSIGPSGLTAPDADEPVVP